MRKTALVSESFVFMLREKTKTTKNKRKQVLGKLVFHWTAKVLKPKWNWIVNLFSSQLIIYQCFATKTTRAMIGFKPAASLHLLTSECTFCGMWNGYRRLSIAGPSNLWTPEGLHTRGAVILRITADELRIRRRLLKSNLPLWQVSEAGHARQTAEDPGEFSMLGHLRGRQKKHSVAQWGNETDLRLVLN